MKSLRQIRKSSPIAESTDGRKDWKVNVHTLHNDGNRSDTEYHIKAAKDRRHAEWIAMNKHGEKLGKGTYKAISASKADPVNEASGEISERKVPAHGHEATQASDFANRYPTPENHARASDLHLKAADAAKNLNTSLYHREIAVKHQVTADRLSKEYVKESAVSEYQKIANKAKEHEVGKVAHAASDAADEASMHGGFHASHGLDGGSVSHMHLKARNAHLAAYDHHMDHHIKGGPNSGEHHAIAKHHEDMAGYHNDHLEALGYFDKERHMTEGNIYRLSHEAHVARADAHAAKAAKAGNTHPAINHHEDAGFSYNLAAKKTSDPALKKKYSELSDHHFAKASEVARGIRVDVSKLAPRAVTESSGAGDSINLRITKHNQQALEASRRGDKAKQQYHLFQVKRLKELEAKKNMSEGVHIVGVTLSEPNHPMVTKRTETQFRHASVRANHRDEAVEKARQHYKRRGYKVHDVFHHSTVSESVESDGIDDLDNDNDELKRLSQLIRLGLMDKQKLPVVLRALRKLDSDQPVNSIAEKQALFELLHNLIGIVTGDTSVFNKVRFAVTND